MLNPTKVPFKKRLLRALIAWAAVSTALFVAEVIGFRLLNGNWNDFSSWISTFLFSAILAPPIGTLLYKLGVQL
jgi:hypothetical protein